MLAPPRSPRRTLWNPVEPSWNPRGTLVEPWWNSGGTLVELRGTIPQGRPGSGLRPQSFQLLGKRKKTDGRDKDQRRPPSLSAPYSFAQLRLLLRRRLLRLCRGRVYGLLITGLVRSALLEIGERKEENTRLLSAPLLKV